MPEVLDQAQLIYPVKVGTRWAVASHQGRAGQRDLTFVAGDTDLGVAWSGDGAMVALVERLSTRSSEVLGGVRLVSAEGVLIASDLLDGIGPQSAAWSPDGTMLAVAGAGGVALYDVPSLTLRGEHRDLPRHSVSTTAWDPTGTRFAVSATNGNPEFFSESVTPVPTPTALTGRGGITGIAWGATGDLALTTSASLLRITSQGGEVLEESPGFHRCPSWSADGASLLFVVDGGADAVRIADLGAGTESIAGSGAGHLVGCPSWRAR